MLTSLWQAAKFEFQITNVSVLSSDLGESLRLDDISSRFYQFDVGGRVLYGPAIGPGTRSFIAAMDRVSDILADREQGLGAAFAFAQRSSLLFMVLSFAPIIILIGLLDVHYPPNSQALLRPFMTVLFTSCPGAETHSNSTLRAEIFGADVASVAPSGAFPAVYARWGLSPNFLVNAHVRLLVIASSLLLASAIQRISQRLSQYARLHEFGDCLLLEDAFPASRLV